MDIGLFLAEEKSRVGCDEKLREVLDCADKQETGKLIETLGRMILFIKQAVPYIHWD